MVIVAIGAVELASSLVLVFILFQTSSLMTSNPFIQKKKAKQQNHSPISQL